MAYVFEDDLKNTFQEGHLLEYLEIKNNKHPKILKAYLSGNLSLETMVVLDQMLNYRKKFDDGLLDPVWELISKKIKNYSPFLSIDLDKYKNILRKVLL